MLSYELVKGRGVGLGEAIREVAGFLGGEIRFAVDAADAAAFIVTMKKSFNT